MEPNLVLKDDDNIESEEECAAEDQILSVAIVDFVENNEINEGMCSCVCINDEQCCGCILQ